MSWSVIILVLQIHMRPKSMEIKWIFLKKISPEKVKVILLESFMCFRHTSIKGQEKFKGAIEASLKLILSQNLGQAMLGFTVCHNDIFYWIYSHVSTYYFSIWNNEYTWLYVKSNNYSRYLPDKHLNDVRMYQNHKTSCKENSWLVSSKLQCQGYWKVIVLVICDRYMLSHGDAHAVTQVCLVSTCFELTMAKTA